MNENVNKLIEAITEGHQMSEDMIVDAVDQIADDLLRQARAEEPELSGQFVEGVEALKAAVAAALGVGTK